MRKYDMTNMGYDDVIDGSSSARVKAKPVSATMGYLPMTSNNMPTKGNVNITSRLAIVAIPPISLIP